MTTIYDRLTKAEKVERPGIMLEWLKTKHLPFGTSNGGIHFFIKDQEDYEVDLWITTGRMIIKEKRTKKVHISMDPFIKNITVRRYNTYMKIIEALERLEIKYGAKNESL